VSEFITHRKSWLFCGEVYIEKDFPYPSFFGDGLLGKSVSGLLGIFVLLWETCFRYITGMSQQLLREKAYCQVKQKIVTMEYPMGKQLVEQDICRELGIGRTPVREALQRLARENLIVIIPRKGMMVSDITAFELNRLYEARAMLEPFCARRAAQLANKEQLRDFRRLFDQAEDMARQRRINELLDLDRNFHEGIVSILENPYIYEMAVRIYDLLARTWHLSFQRRSFEELTNTITEHLCIVNALESRDPDKAEAAVLEHLRQYRAKVLQEPLRAE
jgi:DNA-binding GntR family transcriptional regulator